MFRRFLKPISRRIFQPKKMITGAVIFGYSIYKHKISLNQMIEEISQETDPQFSQLQSHLKQLDQFLKKILVVQVCQSKAILQGGRKNLLVKDYNNKEKKIMLFRLQGQLYAVSGVCPHKQPFDQTNQSYSLQNSICINDKLFCPHHGCIFSIKSGAVQHGPALNSLTIFKVQQKNGVINLIYPSAIPTSILPNYAQKDPQDLRKTLILGGDDTATIGCINGLRQFGYSGEISVVLQNDLKLYKKQYFHKSIINLHLDENKLSQSNKAANQKQSIKINNNLENAQLQKNKKQKVTQQDIDNLIKKQLQQKIYKKLQIQSEKFYADYGIEFIRNQYPYRIINKQYYPYITCADGTKLEFDALLVATGIVNKIKPYESITVNTDNDIKVILPQNVFSPYRSKEQHTKLLSFLNKNEIEKLLVLGYNVHSLQFVQALNKQFPNIKVSIIDDQETSSVSSVFGPQLQKSIIKEFTSRGTKIYIKILEELLFSNKFSSKKSIKNLGLNNQVNNKKKYNDSITVRIADDLRIKADGVVIFPHQFSGHTESVKRGKYTDLDYFSSNRLCGDTFGRTQSIRIFSAGLGSANQYYLTNKRLVHLSPNMSYEQGFNAALNMQALKIPLTYIPFDTFQFFDKKILSVGTRDFYDSILMIGSLQDWDFIAIYALGNQIKSATASPSRAKQINILRQGMRVNCLPRFPDLTNGVWTIQNLQKLIRKMKKTWCYRDIIFKNRQNVHQKDIIWMQRSADAGFQNDRPILDQQLPSQEVGPGGVLKDL